MLLMKKDDLEDFNNNWLIKLRPPIYETLEWILLERLQHIHKQSGGKFSEKILNDRQTTFILTIGRKMQGI